MRSVRRAALALVLAASCAWFPSGADADGQVVAVPVLDVLRDVATARFVQVTSYVVSPRSQLRKALAAACLAGAHVGVLVSSSDLGGVGRSNDAFAASMRPYGFVAEEAGSADGGGRCAIRKSRRPLHMKSVYAANFPGQPSRRVLYLSDENFSTGYYVRDEREADMGLVARAAREDAGWDGQYFSTAKGTSLALEARAVEQAAGPELVVESESFGPGTALTDALERRAGRIPIRLIVADAEYSRSRSEQAYVHELVSRFRIRVRVSRATDKLAASGDVFWLGSTNSTAALNDQIDWGLAGRDAGLADMARGVFERNWAGGTDAS